VGAEYTLLLLSLSLISRFGDIMKMSTVIVTLFDFMFWWYYENVYSSEYMWLDNIHTYYFGHMQKKGTLGTKFKH
jgi:hypothetical protein